jgi:hypothetical protein
MKLKILTISALTFCVLGCNKMKHEGENETSANTIVSKPGPVENSTDSLLKLENYQASLITDTAQSQVINFNCAVIIFPNKEQIATMKNENGDDFLTIAEDASYYQTTALQILDSLKIKTLGSTKNYVTFNGDLGKWTLNVRKKGLPEWNLIFFNTKKEPQIVSEVTLTAGEAAAYFDIE